MQEKCLGPTESAVLRVLVDRAGRVTGRHDLNRLAGVEGSERRCDAALVVVRRALGEGSVVTVRRRGWMLRKESVDSALALLDSSS
jgi:DNA-binding winged helix-turn-helix (wHTH) protein